MRVACMTVLLGRSDITDDRAHRLYKKVFVDLLPILQMVLCFGLDNHWPLEYRRRNCQYIFHNPRMVDIAFPPRCARILLLSHSAAWHLSGIDCCS